MNVCIHCGRELVQKRFSSGVLESPSMLARRRFCSRACMAESMRKETCSSLSHSRMKAASTAAKACEICGTTEGLHVHHVDENPRNNTPSNLRTLCPSCHRRCHSPNFMETGEQRKPCAHCDKPSMKTGLCNTHLSRLKRYGHPLAKKRKTASGWVLMLYDGENWSPFPSKTEPETELDVCAAMVTPSTRNKRKSS